MMVKEWDLQSSNPSRRNIKGSNHSKINFNVERSQRFEKHEYGYVEFVVLRRTYVHHHRIRISFSFFHTGNMPKPQQHIMDLVSSLILFQRAILDWNLARLMPVYCSGFIMAPFIVVIVVFHCPLGLCFVMTKLVYDVDCEKLGEAVDAPTWLHRSDG